MRACFLFFPRSKMRRRYFPSLTVLICLAFNAVFIKPCFSEYNLATGQEESIFISSDKEVKMGESLSRQVEKKFKTDESYTNQERAAIIGEKLAKACDRKDIIYHFKVLVDKSREEANYNAFALPGGYVYIFKGLLEKMDSDDEIAAVLAHEIGHICARHAVKRIQDSMGYEIMRILIIRGAEDNYTRYRANQAINQLMLSYSRQDEIESDRLAVKYLKKAGYRPDAMITALDKLIKLQMEGPARPKRYWHTHPYLSARRSALSKEIKGEMDFDDYINITPDEGYVSSQ